MSSTNCPPTARISCGFGPAARLGDGHRGPQECLGPVVGLEAAVCSRPGGGDSPGRRCIQLGGGFAANVNLSTPNPLAVRPGTRYVLSGKLSTAAPDTSVQLSAGSLDFGPPLRAGRPDVWTRFERQFETGAEQRFIDQISLRLDGGGTAWLDELSLCEAAGGAELLWEAAIRDPIRGFYNPTDCFILDQLVEAAERKGLYLQLCLVTRDLYMVR